MSVYTTTKTVPPSSSPSVAPEFVIDLDLKDVTEKFEFENAMTTWSKVITGDLPDIAQHLPGSSACGPWPSFVDDVFICGRFQRIDGPGKVLGSAGPRYYRTASGTPITGEMRFDQEDVVKDWFNLLGVIVSQVKSG